MKEGDKKTITINHVSRATNKYWCRAGDTVTIVSEVDQARVIVETKSKHRFTTLKTNLI